LKFEFRVVYKGYLRVKRMEVASCIMNDVLGLISEYFFGQIFEDIREGVGEWELLDIFAGH